MTETTSQFSRFFIAPEERPTSEIPFHNDSAPGVRRVFLEKKLLPETDAYVIVRTAADVRPDQPQYIDFHAHNVSSIYLFMGEGDNLEGLRAEVMLGDETFVIDSPATVYIPKGVPHSSRLIEGSGHFGHIVLSGDYRESLLGPSDSISISQIQWSAPPKGGE